MVLNKAIVAATSASNPTVTSTKAAMRGDPVIIPALTNTSHTSATTPQTANTSTANPKTAMRRKKRTRPDRDHRWDWSPRRGQGSFCGHHEGLPGPQCCLLVTREICIPYRVRSADISDCEDQVRSCAGDS